MGLASFSVAVTPGGVTGMVNDTDLSELEVQRITVDRRNGEIPVIYLETKGDGVIRGEGVVQQSIQLAFDQNAAVQAWLDLISSKALEEAIVDRLTDAGLGEMTTSEAVLEVLRKWASDGVSDGS